MTDIWKRKLLAFLHDPPSKAVNIADHEQHAQTLYRQAGFSEEEARDYSKHFARLSDWTASAADRLPFPSSRTSGLSCAFDGVRNVFLHPLGSGGNAPEALGIPFDGPFLSADAARETDQTIQPVLSDESLSCLPEDERWRARFFAHWRLWHLHATQRDYRFALLPADTRLPDHTVWTHMQVVSALDSCAEGVGKNAVLKPAFLRFQLGPVQPFIAASRSVRDLWSGSYLLSWLIAAGLKALSAEVGPDAVIYPSLRGQPLFDLHWRDELWSKVCIGDKSVWESLGYRNDDRSLLTPNLPNVFLAVVPASRASDLGKLVSEAVLSEWRRIAAAVWEACAKEGLTNDEGGITGPARKTRFESQVEQFLSLSWQATPWPETLDAALGLAAGFGGGMPIEKARGRVQRVVDMAQKEMLLSERDRRFYTDDNKTKLNNIGLGWSVILALNGWELDAARQTRTFSAAASGGWETGTFCNKDALTGREEAVAGGNTWSERAGKLGGLWGSLFKHPDWIGATTLIKRVWHFAYLAEAPWSLETSSKGFPMPNTRGVAAHRPEEDCGDDETAEDANPSENYFAVLTFDGDEIGKWVSGEKTPCFGIQLADYADGSKQRQGSKVYFERAEFKGFLTANRPLSPSYHLQFSEALSNFALICARPIIEAFDGRLIYAGGDDVVALLPADTALACATALRTAFRGETALEEQLAHAVEQLPPERKKYFHQLAQARFLLKAAAPGFVLSGDTRADHAGHFVPMIVPGPAADASVGIAIAHFKAPLQDVVRAAQEAEKRAKKRLDRSAVAVTLFKRSGETIEWGCKWTSGGLDLYRALAGALRANQLSSKFPYRVVELLDPYLTEQTGLAKMTITPEFEAGAGEIIQREFAVACGRQRGPAWTNGVTEQLLCLLTQYVAELKGSETKLRGVIGLCQTVAFVNRITTEDKT